MLNIFLIQLFFTQPALSRVIDFDAGRQASQEEIGSALRLNKVHGVDTLQVVNTTIEKSRIKRFDYEDHHEWPDDDDMDYDLDDDDEDDLTLVDRIGKHWQTVAVRGLFFLVGLCMLLFICCCCCKIFCRVCCRSLQEVCVPCRGFLRFISAYLEDPMYTRAKEMAEMFGLKLDYDTYLKIKERFDMGSDGPYNPLGLPHME